MTIGFENDWSKKKNYQVFTKCTNKKNLKKREKEKSCKRKIRRGGEAMCPNRVWLNEKHSHQ